MSASLSPFRFVPTLDRLCCASLAEQVAGRGSLWQGVAGGCR